MKKLSIIAVLFYLGFGSLAQEKKALTFDDILKWNRITEKIISNDGNTIVYKAEPWKGDAVLKIVSKSGKEIESINYGADAIITNNSHFVIVTIKPAEEVVRQLKLKKTKEEDMPLNNLGMYNLKLNTLK